jgi:hypothetical protein
MPTSTGQPYDQTVKVNTDDNWVVIEIPDTHVVWSVNPRGDHTFVTIKKVVL